MSDGDLGTVSSNGDTSEVRLERDLAAIPDEVLSALTEIGLRRCCQIGKELDWLADRLMAKTATSLFTGGIPWQVT
jgi:hypothetical protein